MSLAVDTNSPGESEFTRPRRILSKLLAVRFVEKGRNTESTRNFGRWGGLTKSGVFVCAQWLLSVRKRQQLKNGTSEALIVILTGSR